MKVVILYRPDSAHARTMETFLHDFRKLHPTARLEVLNVDSRDGVAMASLYDIMQYPAIMALASDGTLLQHWQGDRLPLMDEVAAYVYSPA